MSKLTGNRVFLLIGASVLIAFITQLVKIPANARTYPLVLIIASFIVLILLLFQEQKPEESIGKENAIRIFIFAIMIGISILLLSKIGYILSTLLFLYVALWYLQLKKNVLFFVFPVILTLAMYFMFTMGLSVILPVGSWISLTL